MAVICGKRVVGLKTGGNEFWWLEIVENARKRALGVENGRLGSKMRDNTRKWFQTVGIR